MEQSRSIKIAKSLNRCIGKLSLRPINQFINLTIKQFIPGQSLVEILLAISLASILLPALITGLVTSREGKASQGQRLEATALLKETEEAVRSIREKGWANISSNGTFHPEIAVDNSWSLIANSQVVNGYTRQVVVSDAQRNPTSGEIVESGGNTDTSTKKIISTVSWTTPFPSKVESISYFQRYLANAAFTETTQAEFADGAFNNTVATNGGPPPTGAVELAQLPTSTVDYGNKFRVAGATSIGNMTNAGAKSSMRFTAQNSKTVTAIRVYHHARNGTATTYRYGLQADVGGLPSGTYLTSFTQQVQSTTGWKTITVPQYTISAGTVYHLVMEYQSDTIAANRFANLRNSNPQNQLYPLTNVQDSQSATLYKPNATSPWGLQAAQPIYELDFNDSTYEGNPYELSTETAIYGLNWSAEKFTLTGGNKTLQSISFYLRKNGTPPNDLTVELRNNANQTVYSGVITTSLAAPTSFAYVTHTLSPPTAITSGQTYRIILRTTDGTNTHSYRILVENTTNAANFNSITYDGTNSIYTSSSDAGTTWSDTGASPANNRDIGGFYFTIPTGGGFAPTGDFTSHATGSFDAGSTVAFNNLIWTANIPANTTLQLQIAVSGSPSGPFDYFGSDGAIGTYFSQSGQIPLNRINGRYLRYRATFTSNGSATPTLNDVSINYSP